MPGFVVRAQVLEGGEWWLRGRDDARIGWAVRRVACGRSGHGRRRVQVRDLPIAGRPVRLVWAKRIWRCPDARLRDARPGPRRTTSSSERVHRSPSGPGRRSAGGSARTVTASLRSPPEFGVGWHTAMGAVAEHGTAAGRRSGPSGCTRADSVWTRPAFLRGRAATRRREMVTGFVDLDRHRLLDVVRGPVWVRSCATGSTNVPTGGSTGIEVAVVDPFRGYATGLSGPAART